MSKERKQESTSKITSFSFISFVNIKGEQCDFKLYTVNNNYKYQGQTTFVTDSATNFYYMPDIRFVNDMSITILKNMFAADSLLTASELA